jgi:MFS transporter, MFS domain-containing protein family, molybdate-anion transporter
MEFYHANFASFALINVLLAYSEYRQDVLVEHEEGAKEKVHINDSKELLKAFKWQFLPIYLLVNGADWLQVCSLFHVIETFCLIMIGTIHLPSI